MQLAAGFLPDSDPGCLSHDERIILLAEIEQARAALDVLQVTTLAALSASDLSEKHWVRDEVACALQIAPATAAGKVNDACDLVELLPRTLSFLADATISMRHATVLLEHVRGLDEATRGAVETRVLRRAPGQTVSQFRQAVRRAVAALDVRDAQARHVDAVENRRVVLTPAEDGMSELWALLPADGATRLMAALNRFADTARSRPEAVADSRSADQRRADALVELAEDAAATRSTSAGKPHLRHRDAGPSVQVTVGLSTLLGCDEQPGELAGYGPIPASMARRIAADPNGTWRRLVTDAAGHLLDASRSYHPPNRLREHVVARDRTCRFPGCRRQARRCELDHRLAWEHGGATTESNLHALCSRHHHLKHEATGWSVARSPDGGTNWRSPTGHVYVEPLDPYAPDPRPELYATG